MSIVPLNSSDEKNISCSIHSFLVSFHVAQLLRKCGIAKIKGVPVMELFAYILSNVFRMGSFYMQKRVGNFHEGFSKNTYYRFFQNAHANWLRFTTLLSERIVNQHLRPLISDSREDCFVIDDTLYERAGYKCTELAARVFDHVDMKYRKGFRLLTIGWTDGCTFLPINFSLLSSPKDDNVLGKIGEFDKRSLCHKRRVMARTKATKVMVELLKTAIKAGHKAKYALMDSWFSHPSQILDIKELGMNVIAMVKRSSKIRYRFDGQIKNIKQIWAACKKRRGRSKYLLSVPVQICISGKEPVNARIVCVRNRNNRKDWIALISTDMSLSEEDIIRIYGKRWDIEVFFKACKSTLLLTKGYHGLSYDALTAHIAIVFVRYMLLAVAKRDNEDDRTIGELFYLMVSEVADLTYSESMLIIATAMLDAVQGMFRLTDAQMDELMERFMGSLPEHLRRNLQPRLAA